MDTPPSGTVTFLFTDIEGSTQLLERLGPAWGATLDAHHALLRAAVEGAGGQQVNTSGDAVFAVFARPPDAVAAAVAAQRALASADWAEGVRLRVRMGLHTGEAERAGQDYAGLDVHRAARISAAASGGQVLLSSVTRLLAERALPEGVHLRDLGEHRLKDLSRPEHLHQLCIEGLPADFPPPRTLDAWRDALPAQPTSFVGREREVAEALSLLDGTRALTLTGPGGTGKTRLALRIAAESAEAFRDGVVFVALSALEDPSLVASTAAAALGVKEEPGRPILASLSERLAGMEVLLVLDNYEQLLGAAALVGELLAAGPGVRILVTSRAPLRVAGEHEYQVRPLALPDPGAGATPEELATSEAVALFVERARAIDPRFALTDENAGAVAEICTSLDGLPLAIELAAARTRVLSPHALLERLGTSLPLLTGGPRDRPERHRTLRAAIRWSYDLLEPDGQAMFRRLAVFAGGWSLEAAEAVCSPRGADGLDTLDTLEALVEQSLVRPVGDASPEPRFRMLLTIREYGLELLAASGEERELRSRHALFFLAFAEAAGRELTGPHQTAWLDRLERDHDNLRAALRWAVESDQAETGLLIAAAIWRFWQLRDHLAEGEARLTELLEAPSASAATPARAAGATALASVVYWRGDYAAARERYEEALALHAALGDAAAAADVGSSLGWVAAATGDWAAARRRFGQAAESARARGDRTRLGFALHGLGMSAHRDGDQPTARAALEEAVALLRASGDTFGLANALYDHGRVLVTEGDHDGGRASLLESLRRHAAAGDLSGIAFALDALSGLALEEGRAERSVRLAAAADGLRESLGALAPSSIIGEWDARAAVRGLIPEGAVAAAWAEGRTMGLERVLTDAEGDGDG
jgi:predicted ATPase/class 3 adenylate cyclase